MELAILAMKKTMIAYMFIIVSIFLVLALCFAVSKNHVSPKNNANIYAMALSIALVVYLLSSFIPFLQDYLNNDIIVQTGIYTNRIGAEDKSTSGVMGIYSVTLEYDGQIKKLSTVPFQEEIFLQGTYEVKAYYTPSSNRLLYIEIIGESD